MVDVIERAAEPCFRPIHRRRGNQGLWRDMLHDARAGADKISASTPSALEESGLNPRRRGEIGTANVSWVR